MLSRLTWRSFRKQFRSYFVYFISMILAVTIFYSFNAMTYDQPLTKQASRDIQIEGILNLGSFVVVLVILFFMLSANRFFIDRRKREIALYQLFGLRKGQIVWQFLVETFVLNVFSYLIGIVMGIIFSRFFTMILVKAMALEIASDFFVSWDSIRFTATVFLLIYAVIAVQNIWIISQRQLIELFQRKNDFSTDKLKTGPLTYLFGSLAVVLLGSCYYLAYNLRQVMIRLIQSGQEIISVPFVILLIFLFCILGTYLFFRFTMKLLFHFLRKRRSRIYRDLRFYSINNSRINILKNWRGLSLVTLIATVAIAVIGLAVSLIAFQMEQDRNANPTEFQVRLEDLPRLEQVIVKNGGTIASEHIVMYKATGSYLSMRLFNSENFDQEQLTNLMGIEEYQKLRQSGLKLPEIHLKNERDAVVFDSEYNFLRSFANLNRKIVLADGVELKAEKILPDILGDAYLRYGTTVIVVSQKVLDQVSGQFYKVALVDRKGGSLPKIAEAVEEELPSKWENELFYGYRMNQGKLEGKIDTVEKQVPSYEAFSGSYNRLNIANRFLVQRRSRRVSGLYIYVTLFVGMVVLLATASILMLRQFSNAESARANFQLLAKVGVTRKEFRQLIYHENAWLFFPPILLTTLHALFAIYSLSRFIVSEYYWIAYLFCGLMAVTYLFAYLLTVRFYTRIVEE